MHGYLHRNGEVTIKKALKRSPVVAILGPRQCGKSTLAHRHIKQLNAVYLDLQNRVDRNKLNEPELFLQQHRHQLVCLDEIQHLPSFFSILRSEVDHHREAGRFLILGSASRDLIRQSSETLAGRISYQELTPFLLSEIECYTDVVTHWQRGGFPESLLVPDDESSYAWRNDFIRTFLERDIPDFGPSGIPPVLIDKLWRLIAHYHGQTVNYSKMAETLDIAVPTLKKYLRLLEQTFMIRLLPPLEINLKKRITKAPKILIRDSGLLHTLLDIERFDDLLAHPCLGASWEGYVIENLCSSFPQFKASFIRTGHGAEIDLVLERAQKRFLIECKVSKAPKPSRGTFELIKDLRPAKTWLVAPVESPYPYNPEITVISPGHLIQSITNDFV